MLDSVNKLNIKKIIIGTVLILLIEQIGLFITGIAAMYAGNLMLVIPLGNLLGVIINVAIPFFLLKGASLKKTESAINGFSASLLAIVLVYLLSALMRGHMLAFQLTTIAWMTARIAGGTVGGFLAGKK